MSAEENFAAGNNKCRDCFKEVDLKTVDTKAYAAQQALDKLLNADNHIYKPWQLHKHSLEPLRLMSTKEEFSQYLFVDAFIRPGFEVKDDKVFVPHLFCKLDGDASEVIAEIRKLEKANPGKVEILYGFNQMNKKPITSFFETKPSWYDEETGLDVDKAMSSTLNSLGHLRPEYRRNYLQAVKRILESVSEGQLQLNPPTPRVILETLIYNSTIVVDMYHRFDYQYLVPKMLVIDRVEQGINAYGALRLMLMNELSFDIVISSEECYSSIENVLSPDSYELYIIGESDDLGLSNGERPQSKKRRRRKMIGYGVFAFLGIILIFFFLKNMFG